MRVQYIDDNRGWGIFHGSRLLATTTNFYDAWTAVFDLAREMRLWAAK